MSSQPTPPAPVTRRRVIQTGVAGAAAAIGAAGLVRAADQPAPTDPRPAAAAASGGRVIQKNRINQTVCKWCYDKKIEPFEKLCAEASKMGYRGIDLVNPDQFATLKKYDLVGTMTNSHPIDPGLAHKENHEMCLDKMRSAIEATAAAGFPSVICFSGNRKGMDDEEGMKNCAEALKKVVGLAEQKKVTICMELLNSKVNHKDYMCDHTAWGVGLCKMVGSERFKLLYDIYHMQIMEGDVIRTLQENKQYIGHYHTGGVPGRHEIDDTQELYYPAIMKAILETGYQGWVGQEFIPEREPLASLRQAGGICDV
jgi:hydroxypyruvate isomerase